MHRSEWILGFFNAESENNVNISYRQPILSKHKIKSGPIWNSSNDIKI
jgi:hypothetical protein